MAKEPQEKVTIFVPASAVEQVKRIAASENRSMSYFMRQAVLNSLLDVVTGAAPLVDQARKAAMAASAKRVARTMKKPPSLAQAVIKNGMAAFKPTKKGGKS